MTRSSHPRLLILHGLRLKGIAEPDVVAEAMGLPVSDVRTELDRLELEGLVSVRYGRIGGYRLTDEGRSAGERLLAAELDEHGLRTDVEEAYRRFLGFNGQLLDVCTAWQLRTVDGETVVNDHTDEAHDGHVRARLLELDALVRPVLDDLAAVLLRFDGHRRRLRLALERILAGESDYLTRPMCGSYHSTWFELHEDLLATLGVDRQTERSL